MRTNVFLRSTRRQPVRTAFLLLVVALVTFTFVGRVSEYLLVERETSRLAEYYRSVGTLKAITRDARKGTPETAAMLLDDPDVELLEQRQIVSAVMEEGCYNADSALDTSFSNSQDMFFYGTLTFSTEMSFRFTVDTVLAGRPEYVEAGKEIFLTGQKNLVADAYANMKVGERYLVRANNLRTSQGELAADLAKLTFSSGLRYLEAPAGQEPDFSDPALAELRLEIEKISSNQRALSLIATQDMKALPETQEMSPAIYLTAGRWLDSVDNTAGRRVCVIHYALASARGWKVGDAIRMSLRDIPADFGYSRGKWTGDFPATEEADFEIVGIYDFIASYRGSFIRNNVYVPAFVVPEEFVNGLEATPSQNYFNEAMNMATGGSLPAAGTISFQLAAPDREENFVERYADALGEMGYELTMMPNNCEDFTAAVKPMRRASLFNVQVYTLVLLVSLCLVVFIYFRARGREIAVVRAMGLPVKRCVREGTAPLMCIALVGVLSGGALGWWNTMRSAAQTLSALAALDKTGEAGTALSPAYLLMLCGSILALVLVLTVGSAVLLAKKPVLEQLQGSVQAKPKRTAPETPPPDAAVLSLEAVRAVRAVLPAAQRRWGSVPVAARFVRRQITRAPVKSVLAGALAAAFAAGLGVIHLSIESDERKIDWLYENTIVRMDILPVSDADRVKSGGFLYEATAQAVVDTGLMSSIYLEGAAEGAVITDASLWTGGPIHLTSQETIKEGKSTFSKCLIRSFDSAESFLSDLGSGSNMSIEYFDGWDASLFSQDWSEAVEAGEEDAIPVVIPQKWSAAYDDDTAGLYRTGDTIILTCRGKLYLCAVAGVCSGGGDTVLLPNSALRAMSGSRMTYSKAAFTVDPSQNRNLGQFRAFIDSIANTPRLGSVPVNIAVWDEELTEAVAPLEESLQLMRILYPVVFVLSLLTAAGTAVLFVMMSAKDAATLRVLGTPRGRTRLILVLQQAVTCFAGLVLGVAGMLACIQQVRPELLEVLASAAVWRGAAYLAAAVAGAAVSAIAVTSKNPLEMLQVKE